MFIYSEQARPYGLLSNFAYTPTYYEGQTWSRASDLIYGQFFQPGPYRDQIVAYQGINPSELFYQLVDKLLQTTFEGALAEGVLERLNSNLKMRQELLRYSEVVLPDYPNLEEIYNNWLSGGDQNLSDKRLVSGLLKAIKAGSNIPDDTPLEDVQHYKAQTSNLKDNDPALKYGSDLIPYLKHRARYEEQLRLFKKKILTQLLNFVIKQEQPDVKDLNKVRQERLSKMTPDQVGTLTDTAYQKYLQGHLSHLSLEREPQEQPFKRTSVLNLSVNWEHPLYIYAEIPLNISVENENRTFRSIIHYGYYKMFQVLGVNLNVSRFNLHDLENIFQRERHNSLRDLLIRNTEVALRVKFGQHPSLAALLKLTVDEPLYWADRNDFILGNADGQGENVVGQVLMQLRSEDQIPTLAEPTDDDPILSDIYLSTWIVDRFKDVFNTLTLFKVPSTSMLPILRQLYGIPKLEGAQPVNCPSELQSELANPLPNYSRVKFALVWELLSDLIYVLLQLDPEYRVQLIVKAQEKLMDPKAKVEDSALKFLKDFYTEHRQLIKVNSVYTFAADLTGMWQTHAKGPYNVFSDARPARIKYFAELGENKIEVAMDLVQEVKRAVRIDNPKAVLSLLKAGANLSDVVKSAVIWAALDVLNKLIEEDFLDPNEALRQAQALKSGGPKVIDMLVREYPEALDANLVAQVA